MSWSKNKKNRYTPAKSLVFYIKVGFKGVYITQTCFHDGSFGWMISGFTSHTTAKVMYGGMTLV